MIEVSLNSPTKNKPITKNRSLSQLRNLELDFYTSLNWHLNLLTPIEFAKLLLYFANPTYDFREIMFKVSSFIYLCLLDADLVSLHRGKQFGAVVSCACIFSALESMGMEEFRGLLEGFYFESLQLDIN